MRRAFIYGVSVKGENLTDRVRETKRLKIDFDNGLNAVFISPRRMGNTFWVRKVQASITDPKIKVVYMDVRTVFCAGMKDLSLEYDFGTKSNLSRIKRALQEREIIEIEGGPVYMADPVFEL